MFNWLPVIMVGFLVRLYVNADKLDYTVSSWATYFPIVYYTSPRLFPLSIYTHARHPHLHLIHPRTKYHPPTFRIVIIGIYPHPCFMGNKLNKRHMYIHTNDTKQLIMHQKTRNRPRRSPTEHMTGNRGYWEWATNCSTGGQFAIPIAGI